jgi:ABC-type multidrug transport system fused ATPase/permease subunit
MLESIKSTFRFLTKKEKFVWKTYTTLRAALSIFDLIGVMAIGIVATSIALFLTNGSDPNRVITLAGVSVTAVNVNTLPIYGSAILGLFLVKGLLSLFLARQSALFLASVDARAAAEIARTMYGSTISQAQSRSREESTFAIQVGSTTAFSGVLNSLSTVAAETTLFVLITLGFFLVNPVVASATLLYFSIVALVVNRIVGSRVARKGKKTVRTSIKANTHVSDLISVFREASTSGAKERFFDKIYDSKLESARSAAIQYVLASTPRYIIESALLVGLTILVIYQTLSFGVVQSATTLSVFLAGGFRLTGALLPLQTAILVINGNVARAKTALEILNTAGQMNSTLSEQVARKVKHSQQASIGVELRNVSFVHKDASKLAIEDVSLKIHPGSKVAIIGDSGAGKSTLADLICGILVPSSGEVLLGIEEWKVAPQEMAGLIGYVPQRPGLISGTIASNVAIGFRPGEINKDRVVESLKKACLWDLISGLPEGINTDVGNLRDNLSGGEIQRIGLARALYSNPKLLVMDEATSALDATSEHEVGKALSSLRGKTTIVLIAHRLNSVQNADKVFLMDSGKVIDSGSFQELVLRNPELSKTVNYLRID